MGLDPTTVWSYGSVNHPETFNYPAFTIGTRGRPTRVKWINDLVKPNGEFRPHLLPVDQTLHWANPPAARAIATTTGTTRPPYRGPVPIVTHLHGGHSTEESDGYPEAWYLPHARNIPAGMPGRARSMARSRPRPRPSFIRLGRPAARSFNTRTTSARRRCGTTTTPSG